MKLITQQLKYDKIKINWNKNPVKMDLFLSFLTVSTVNNPDCMGSSTGWTERRNDEYKLIVSGGVVNGVNYIDSIQYGHRLANPYNNYVTPFHLLDIMTDEGKLFFIGYYKTEIEEVFKKQQSNINYAKKALKCHEETMVTLSTEYAELADSINI